ncbi:GNAT family N-acetyltransferase [Enterococcus sp. LJL120]
METTGLIENRNREMFELGKYAFRSTDTPEVRQRFDCLVEHSWNYGHLVDDVLASQLQATPFDIWIGPKLFKMAGIGTVSSYPEYRGQGGINKLMEKMLNDLNQAGVALTYLAPFSYPFYRRYGYEYLFEKTIYEIAGSDWPKANNQVGTVKRLNFQEAQADIKNVYEAVMANQVGPVKRADWWYQYKFEMHHHSQYAVYFDEEGLAKGYLAYRFDEGQFTIIEWEYLTAAAFWSLANYCGSHRDSFEKFHYETGKSDSNLNFLFAKPALQVSIRPEMMGRIVNAANFLEEYPFLAAATNLNFILELTEDRYAPWNTGKYQITISANGDCQIVSDNLQAELSTLTCDIQGLTQLMLGFRSGEELKFFEKIQAPEDLLADLDQRILPQKPILEDYF